MARLRPRGAVTQQSTEHRFTQVPDTVSDRRTGPERRSAQRRGDARPVAEERRDGGDRRFWEERRSSRRRRARDLAAHGPAGYGTTTLGTAERERARARRLLDDFGTLSGAADKRLVKLVRRQWPSYPLGARALLVETLHPMLGDVPAGAPLTEELRAAVEEAVVEWAARI